MNRSCVTTISFTVDSGRRSLFILRHPSTFPCFLESSLTSTKPSTFHVHSKMQCLIHGRQSCGECSLTGNPMAPDQGNLIPGASHMSPPPTHHHQGFSTNQPHHATARSINTQAWQYPHPSASTPRPSMLGPPGTPQSSPLLGQHFRGYPMNQPYHAAAPSTPTSAYGYSPTNAFVPPPFNVRPQQPYHGRHASVAAFSGTGYGAHPAAVSGIQHPQAFTIGGESASGSPPKKIMKHLTCFYWNTYGNCKYAESNCLYSHTHEGTNGVAEAPVQKQPGSKWSSRVSQCRNGLSLTSYSARCGREERWQGQPDIS